MDHSRDKTRSTSARNETESGWTGEIPSRSRRTFLGCSGAAVLPFAFAQHLFGSPETTDSSPAHDAFPRWKENLHRLSRQLSLGEISSLEWQEGIDAIYRTTPIPALLRTLSFDTLKDEIITKSHARGRGEFFHRVPVGVMPDADRKVAETSRVLITKIAHVEKGHSIPPHGHSNMVSAFLCVNGEFDVRLFDKVEADEDHMVVRKTLDVRDAKPGTWSSISDYRDNVHWLTAKSGDCFLFTCKLIRVEDARPFSGRINCDVKAGDQLGADTWRAPIISSAQAAERY